MIGNKVLIISIVMEQTPKHVFFITTFIKKKEEQLHIKWNRFSGEETSGNIHISKCLQQPKMLIPR